MITPIELGSEEFYVHYYPNAKPNTVKSHKRVVNSLLTYLASHPDDVGGWITEKHNDAYRYKERYLFANKFNGIYWNLDMMVYKPRYLEFQKKINKGENVTVHPSNTDENLLDQFKLLDEKMPVWRQQPVTKYLLFGCFLPPRRLDVYQLHIRSTHTSNEVNYYHKPSSTFVFNDFKNSTKKKQQKYSVLSLSPLYADQDVLHRAITFLDNQPDGLLFTEKSISYQLDKTYGCCNTTLRKYWGSKVHKSNIPKTAKIILADWMDHSMDMLFRYYLIEGEQQQPQPQDDKITEDPFIEINHQCDMSVQTEPMESSDYQSIITSQEQQITELKAKVAKLESINKKYLELINLVN